MLLYETQIHSGTFTGSVDTTSGVFKTVQSGIVQAATQGSFLTMTYSDQVPAAFRSFKVKVASIAQITTNPEILSAGNNISITLQDADLNTDANVAETASVTVKQFTVIPLDTRQVTLTENGMNCGIFTAILQTSVFSSNAGGAATAPIYAPEGSFLSVSVIDANPVPASVRNKTVPVSTRGVISLQCLEATWTVCSQYDITVKDTDLNGITAI